MADHPELDEAVETGRSARVVALLDYLGWIVIAAAVAWAAVGIVRINQASTQVGAQLATIEGNTEDGNGDDETADAIAAVRGFVHDNAPYQAGSVIALMIAGVAGGVLLWGLAEAIRHADQIQQSSEQAAFLAGGSRLEAAGPGGAVVRDDQTLEEMVVLLREVRDISLLSAEQRTMRLDAQGKAALNLLQREAPALLREHNWIEARNRVQEARERFPMFREWDALERQIEEMRERVEAHDIDAAERQIKDLTALGAWDRVDDVINELLERHPDSQRAIDLVQGARAARNQAEAEQRARLMAQAQEAANARDWSVALNTATTLVQRYPKSPEAQAVRLQLPTLRANAQVKERQQIEGDIRDLIKRQRYEEALRIARQLLDQYPASPQADALREQLPKLEEKAALVRR